jgi:hypothetical protein
MAKKPKPEKPVEYVVCDSVRGTIRCQHCGQEIPFPIGRVDAVVALIRAYVRVHAECQPGDPPPVTRRSTAPAQPAVSADTATTAEGTR